jgi:Ca-activated chloride channel family protein
MSGSMISEDFQVQNEPVNRFNMARNVLKGFIDKRPKDRIGLVFLHPKLILRHPDSGPRFLIQNLDRLKIGDIEQNRNAVGSALSSAVNRLRELKSKSKIVVLMTDGQTNAGKFNPLPPPRLLSFEGKSLHHRSGKTGHRANAVGRDPFTGRSSGAKSPSTSMKRLCRKSHSKPAANITARTMQKLFKPFTPKLINWKKQRRT